MAAPPRRRAALANPKAREFLRNADPVLARLIDARPDFRPRAWMDELPPFDAFGTLIFGVAGQQLSVASTRAIVGHLEERFGGHMPSAAELLAADPQVLRDSGFSTRKGQTLRELAQRFVDGRLSDKALARMSDEEVEAALTEVPGIGLWSARGFLLVALNRPDVFLSGDLALRRAIQRAYGFDHLYGADELGLEEWEESDAQMFAAAKRIYDKVRKPGQPVFIMILTLNQHGPHDHQPMATLPRPYRNLLRGLPANTALNFDTYLSRLHDSDLAMRALEHAFLDRPQPTVLLHFGDHQPSFNGQIRNLSRRLPPALQPYQHYLTYYMLKSNFAGPPLPAYPMLDIAFLPSMVLQAAGLPTDAYFTAASGLRERCNGLYSDCAVPGLLASYHAWTIGRLHVYQ